MPTTKGIFAGTVFAILLSRLLRCTLGVTNSFWKSLMLKKRVDLRSSDIIQNDPLAKTLWMDLYLSLFVRKRHHLYLCPCIEGMVAFRGDLKMYEADPKVFADDLVRSKRDLHRVIESGFSIELDDKKDSYLDSITVGEDYLTRTNIELILPIYMERRGLHYKRIKFIWRRTDFVIWPA